MKNFGRVVRITFYGLSMSFWEKRNLQNSIRSSIGSWAKTTELWEQIFWTASVFWQGCQLLFPLIPRKSFGGKFNQFTKIVGTWREIFSGLATIKFRPGCQINPLRIYTNYLGRKFGEKVFFFRFWTENFRNFSKNLSL